MDYLKYSKHTEQIILEASGKLIKKLENKKGTSNNHNWKYCQFVIETENMYNPNICFTIWNDRIEMVDRLDIGDNIKVHFKISSKEVDGRYFNNITAIKIERINYDLSKKIPDKIVEDPDLPF
jgi:hypothetical protein